MSLDRRHFLTALSAAGAAAVLPTTEAEETSTALSPETLAQAERLTGLTFSAEDRQLMLGGLEDHLEDFAALRQVSLPNHSGPALLFNPVPPGQFLAEGISTVELPTGAAVRPVDPVDLAFSSVAELSRLLRSGQVSSRELTELYLSRLERFDPALACVITLTRERALKEADQADRDRLRGGIQGPLHGIPWGAKDLLAAAGYPTTWGAGPFRNQHFDHDATVVERLSAAGAVLVAKLTLGELAWGDEWFGGKTKNPWNLEQGSSGSSAGSAAATAAGLVGFALGSETWGSIVSPSSRCGTTGLRPTFGRVARTGAMALSWSMDKIGPICRSAEDCALVFASICGPDGQDRTVRSLPFTWPYRGNPRKLRVGFLRALFEAPPEKGAEEDHARDLATLETLRGLGVDLIPVELPSELPITQLSFILGVEAAAAFDELTRSGQDDQLVRQVEQAWPNVFRQARLIPAVEYLQANRVRALLCERMSTFFAAVDLVVAPSFGGDQLLLTNLTGHPALVLPNGLRKDGTPTSISFVGRLYEEEKLLAFGHLYQQATEWHRRRPPLDEPVAAATRP